MRRYKTGTGTGTGDEEQGLELELEARAKACPTVLRSDDEGGTPDANRW